MTGHREVEPRGLVREAGWATTDAQEAARAQIARAAVPWVERWKDQAPPLLALIPIVVLFAVSALVGYLAGLVAFGVSSALFIASIIMGGEAETRIECEELAGFEITLGERGRHVSVGIWQGDALTGEDEGLLWFEDGRLYFSGRRTSFGLVPAQVRGRPRMRRGWTEDQVELSLRRDTVAGPMRLAFRLRPYALNADFDHRAALRTDLDVWTQEPVSGEGQFPPATLGPGLPTERRLLAEAASLTFPPAILLAWVFNLLLHGAWQVGLILGLFVFAGMVPAGNLRWRALRDRRRLRQ